MVLENTNIASPETHLPEAALWTSFPSWPERRDKLGPPTFHLHPHQRDGLLRRSVGNAVTWCEYKGRPVQKPCYSMPSFAPLQAPGAHGNSRSEPRPADSLGTGFAHLGERATRGDLSWIPRCSVILVARLSLRIQL